MNKIIASCIKNYKIDNEYYRYFEFCSGQTYEFKYELSPFRKTKTEYYSCEVYNRGFYSFGKYKFYEHFITEKQIRKQKLEKINKYYER